MNDIPIRRTALAVITAAGLAAWTVPLAAQDTMPSQDQTAPAAEAPAANQPAEGEIAQDPGGAAGEDGADESAIAEAAPPPEKVITEQEESHRLSADLIGSDVMHPEHGTIGTLESLLFDDQDKIVGGVVSVGGFLGIGAKSVALSWDEFDVRTEQGAVYVGLTREQLEAAPAFRDLATIQAERELERQRQMAQQEADQGQQSY